MTMAASEVMCAGFTSLWEEGLLLDYTIEVEGQEFQAHKAVLASMSGYFRVMLTNGMLEAQHNRVQLQGFSPLAVQNMIHFMYQKKFTETQAPSDEMFGLAMYLQIPSAITMCTDTLLKEMDIDNCLDLLALFATHAVEEGITRVQKFIKTHVDLLAIIGAEEPIKLPLEVVSHLHDCWRTPEVDLFRTIREWVMDDYANHKKHVNDLMSKIRFPLIPFANLEGIKAMSIYIDSPGPWHALIDKAIEYHNMPVHRRVLVQSEETTMRTDPTPVYFHIRERPVSYFHGVNMDREWSTHRCLHTPSLTPGVAAVQVHDFLIVYNQQFSDRNTYIFDPRQRSWTLMASMAAKRDFAFVYHDDHLYAIGGCRNDDVTDGIDRYDFQSNTWSAFSTLPVPIFKLAACSIEGAIYTSGGKYELDGRDINRLACFNPTEGTWQTKTPSRRWSGHSLQVMEINRHHVMAVINMKLHLYYYNPATDHWTIMDLLHALPSRSRLCLTPESSVLAHGKCLYLTNPDYPLNMVCAKWTIKGHGVRKCEYGEFPILTPEEDVDLDGKKNYCTALLPIASRLPTP